MTWTKARGSPIIWISLSIWMSRRRMHVLNSFSTYMMTPFSHFKSLKIPAKVSSPITTAIAAKSHTSQSKKSVTVTSAPSPTVKSADTRPKSSPPAKQRIAVKSAKYATLNLTSETCWRRVTSRLRRRHRWYVPKGAWMTKWPKPKTASERLKRTLTPKSRCIVLTLIRWIFYWINLNWRRKIVRSSRSGCRSRLMSMLRASLSNKDNS